MDLLTGIHWIDPSIQFLLFTLPQLYIKMWGAEYRDSWWI